MIASQEKKRKERRKGRERLKGLSSKGRKLCNPGILEGGGTRFKKVGGSNRGKRERANDEIVRISKAWKVDSLGGSHKKTHTSTLRRKGERKPAREKRS